MLFWEQLGDIVENSRYCWAKEGEREEQRIFKLSIVGEGRG